MLLNVAKYCMVWITGQKAWIKSGKSMKAEWCLPGLPLLCSLADHQIVPWSTLIYPLPPHTAEPVVVFVYLSNLQTYTLFIIIIGSFTSFELTCGKLEDLAPGWRANVEIPFDWFILRHSSERGSLPISTGDTKCSAALSNLLTSPSVT